MVFAPNCSPKSSGPANRLYGRAAKPDPVVVKGDSLIVGETMRVEGVVEPEAISVGTRGETPAGADSAAAT